MKKSVLVIIGIVVLMVVGIIVIVASQGQQNQQNQPSANQTETQPTNTKVETTNSITIKDMDFSVKKTTITKGTTVTWTNEDNIGHNVIASDPNNAGGLPTSAPILKKGETFSFTFNEIGNFAYHCAPHPNMRGAVEVIEQ